MAAPNDIILGEGVFAIGGVDIALTRGGGQFTIEREYRQIEADGDHGPVMGRIAVDRSIAKLALNALEILPANLPKMYPATKLTAGTGDSAGTDTITGTLTIAEADYQSVTWTGKTKGGKAVIITLDNAINLENLDWTLQDKDEVVPTITYTAAYKENARDEEPWKVEFVGQA